MTKISVIIPAFNERATIIELLEMVNRQMLNDFELEIIVIDDGSTDGSVKLLEERTDLYKHFIQLPSNQGKGAAVKAGLEKATGEYVLFQDADLEYDPQDYTKLLLPIERFQSDVVMGSRVVAPQYTRVYYFWHKVGNTFLTLLFNMLYNTTFTDVYSCYLVYRRSLVNAETLRTTGWEQHAEILAKAAKKAKIIYEVPISYHGRAYDEGKKIKARHAIAVMITMILERIRS